MSLVDAAHDYATRGLAVFPCRVGSKQPATTNGFYNASTDADQIQAWWRTNPSFNVAIACGASGLVVIDIDGSDGEAGFAELESRLGRLPDTTTALTPGRGGGRHLIFCGGDELCTMGDIAPGVDLKAGGGYIVAVPSTHPDGGEYRFEKGKSFAEKAPAKLPPQWVDYLKWMWSERAYAEYQSEQSALLPPVSLPIESRAVSISIASVGSVFIGK